MVDFADNSSPCAGVAVVGLFVAVLENIFSANNFLTADGPGASRDPAGAVIFDIDLSQALVHQLVNDSVIRDFIIVASFPVRLIPSTGNGHGGNGGSVQLLAYDLFSVVGSFFV